MDIVYCMDTSAWIEMRYRYPFAHFPSLWGKLDTLIHGNRLISPQEVYKELEKKDDEIFKWVKQRRNLFRSLDEEQIALAMDIQAKFPGLIDSQKEIPDADPFVIALAFIENRNLTMFGGHCLVVSEEKPGSSSKPKIPDVCNTYNIGHCSSVGLIESEGWIF